MYILTVDIACILTDMVKRYFFRSTISASNCLKKYEHIFDHFQSNGASANDCLPDFKVKLENGPNKPN